MAYAKMIEAGLNKAFATVKDLAVPVVLSKKASSDFDFGQGAVTASTSNINAELVVTKRRTTSKEKPITTLQGMLKTALIGDLSAYDTLVMQGISYRFTQSQTSNGYVTVVELVKEA